MFSDHNNDRKVSEDEFVALPGGDLDGAFQESDKLWLEERRKEFRKIIDLDHNGYVDWVELKVRGWVISRLNSSTYFTLCFRNLLCESLKNT